MLDYLFMSKMNARGRRYYMVGTLVIALLLFSGLLTTGALDNDEGYIVILVVIILTIVPWGFFCMRRWPKDEAYCPWCQAKNSTPAEGRYTCVNCGRDFLLGKKAKVKKVTE